MNKIAFFILMAFASISQAAVIRYHYQGTPFDDVDVDLPGVTEISGYFDVDEGLPANLFLQTIAVENFLFTDGSTTVAPGQGLSMFSFSTDANGAITEWDVALRNEQIDDFIVMGVASSPGLLVGPPSSFPPPWYSVAYYEAFPTPPNGGGTELCNGAPCVPPPRIASGVSPGSWSVAVVPIPAPVWLLGSAIGLLFSMERRHTRTHVAA